MPESAASSASCTVPPPGCVCQPRKRLPPYSMPSAMRVVIMKKPRSLARRGLRVFSRRLAEARQHLFGLALLRAVALFYDFVEQFARSVLVAHLLVSLGEIQFGGDLLPLRVRAARTGARRLTEVEAQAAEIERCVGRGCRRRGFALRAAEVQVEVEVHGDRRIRVMPRLGRFLRRQQHGLVAIVRTRPADA